jgi:hypothetical protein
MNDFMQQNQHLFTSNSLPSTNQVRVQDPFANRIFDQMGCEVGRINSGGDITNAFGSPIARIDTRTNSILDPMGSTIGKVQGNNIMSPLGSPVLKIGSF